MEIYSSVKVNEHLTCIRSVTGELMYLLEGENECALIDSCFGVGHLRAYVESLTKKPVKLFLTHGHVDHAMGAPEFDTVYLNSKDIPLYQSQCTIEERKEYAAVMGIKAGEIADSEYLQSEPEKKFEELKNKMTFDIGRYHLDAFEFPGHTRGSMIFLIREMKILILGDACNNSTFLFAPNLSPLTDYKKALIRNRDILEGKYNRVFTSHHVMEVNPDIMNEMIDVCDDALAGKCDDIPFEFMGMKAYIAKKCNERFEREDGKTANIVYNKDNL